jgi:hypothetical protein
MSKAKKLLDFLERKDSLGRDRFIINGKKRYGGVVNLLDGIIEDTFTFDKAEENDWHHNFYLNLKMINKIKDGESSVFWVEKDGSIVNSEGDLPQNIKDKIKKQISIPTFREN